MGLRCLRGPRQAAAAAFAQRSLGAVFGEEVVGANLLAAACKSWRADELTFCPHATHRDFGHALLRRATTWGLILVSHSPAVAVAWGGPACCGCGGRSWDRGEYENVGRSQPVLIMINPMISPRTRIRRRRVRGFSSTVVIPGTVGFDHAGRDGERDTARAR
jgi:hypothetical protein